MSIIKTSFFQTVLTFFFNIVSGLFRKKPRLVVFGAGNGYLYADNSRHLFEWILKNRKDIQPIWLSRDEKVVSGLRQKNMPAVQIKSWQGIKTLAQTRLGVYTSSLRDLAICPFCLPDSIRLVALRHGKSVKRVRFARLGDKISDFEYRERKRESHLIQQAISTSGFVSEIQEECLCIGIEKHKVTGYPRNDMLFEKSLAMQKEWEEYLNGNQPQQVVLYGPSWRHGREATRFFPFPDFDQQALSRFLVDKKILVLLRPHKNDLKDYPELTAFLARLEFDCPNIRLATHREFPDVNLLLPFVDILITDYSSLYHDYLLLDRPIIFTPYDYADYEKKNGFLYDYFHYLPGPAVYRQSELLTHLDSLLIGNDPFGDKRRTLRDMIHQYQDANSCKRVTDLITDLHDGK